MFILSGRWQHDVEINRSRFRAIALPLTSVEDWEPALASVTDPAASHCCWAWRYGDAYRSSDAGEPAGSAGRPILNAIDTQSIDHAMVAVLRWFGGVKLGVGGLVRAYGGTAAECLRQAPREPLVDRVNVRLFCGFEHADTVYRMLMPLHASVDGSRFDSEGLHLQVSLPRSALPALRNALANATRRRGRIERVDSSALSAATGVPDVLD